MGEIVEVWMADNRTCHRVGKNGVTAILMDFDGDWLTVLQGNIRRRLNAQQVAEIVWSN